MVRKVIWSNTAKESLKEHYDYIRKDSLSAAKLVRSQIIESSKQLEFHSEKYQLDEFYPNNPGNIRRFFRWSYRIIYQVSEKTTEILNVLHTSQEPTQE